MASYVCFFLSPFLLGPPCGKRTFFQWSSSLINVSMVPYEIVTPSAGQITSWERKAERCVHAKVGVGVSGFGFPAFLEVSLRGDVRVAFCAFPRALGGMLVSGSRSERESGGAKLTCAKPVEGAENRFENQCRIGSRADSTRDSDSENHSENQNAESLQNHLP